MPTTTEERLVDLEIKLMHQDRLVDTLNQVVIELRAEVDALRKHVDRLIEERRGGTQGDDAPANDPPPHY
jgi:SlyX protein